jgi:hypothetical protein
MDNFEAGDKVFLFGFSRGAYTARALGAMLHMFGLLRKGDDVQFPYAARMFKKKLARHDFEIAEEFKATFSRICKPHFVGVWDTVSSVGWIYDPVHLPFTKTNPDIVIGRHAISIDERRCMYRQNMWGSGQPNQDLKQVWFAGVHSDIGGGFGESESGLSKATLAWMVNEAKAAGLLTDPALEHLILCGAPPIPHDPISEYNQFQPWAPDAPIHFMAWWWWFLEFFPKQYQSLTNGQWVRRWKIPLGRRRFIAEGSLVHSSVVARIQKISSYRPANLPQEYFTEP